MIYIMQVHLAYGRNGLPIDLPYSFDVVSSKFIPGLPDERAALEEALRCPIGSVPLREKVKPGETLSKAYPKGHFFSEYKAHPGRPCTTLTASNVPIRWDQPQRFSEGELKIVQSFPDDYNFLKTKPSYVIGMSVPPFMTQRVALEVGRQWFNLEYD